MVNIEEKLSKSSVDSLSSEKQLTEIHKLWQDCQQLLQIRNGKVGIRRIYYVLYLFTYFRLC